MDFAMNIEGTQIAKDAANIILLNDNLTCIVVVAKWRRNVFDSMQGFPQFQLTVSTAILLLNAICACISVLCLLTGLHLLWLSLILDSINSMALVSDPPTDELKRQALPECALKGMACRKMLHNFNKAPFNQEKIDAVGPICSA